MEDDDQRGSRFVTCSHRPPIESIRLLPPAFDGIAKRVRLLTSRTSFHGQPRLVGLDTFVPMFEPFDHFIGMNALLMIRWISWKGRRHDGGRPWSDQWMILCNFGEEALPDNRL